MKPTTVRIFIIVAAPLLLIAALVLLTSSPGQTIASSDFVHPTIPGSNGMLRAQGGDTPSTSPTVTPSSENVTDTYYHEIFVLEEKLARTPEDTLSMRLLGRLFQDGHKMTDADRWYSEYLSKRPRARQVWLDLSAARAGDSQWAKAEQAITSMLEIYPGDASAQYNLGAIAANAGDLTRARTLWEKLSGESTDATIAGMATRSLARLNQN